MTRIRPRLWLTLGLALAACEGEPTEGPAAPTAEAPEAPARAERETVEAPVPDEAARGLREAGQAIEEAMRAAADVTADTPCETAYQGALAMIAQLREDTGQSGTGTAPDEAAFLRACNRLPPEAQQCMVMSHALEHRAECEAWKSDPRVVEMRSELATVSPRPAP